MEPFGAPRDAASAIIGAAAIAGGVDAERFLRLFAIAVIIKRALAIFAARLAAEARAIAALKILFLTGEDVRVRIVAVARIIEIGRSACALAFAARVHHAD